MTDTYLRDLYDAKSDERGAVTDAIAGRDLPYWDLIRRHKAGNEFIELGFGRGSLLLHAAKTFDRCIGVDISAKLRERAASFASSCGYTNASFVSPEEFRELGMRPRVRTFVAGAVIEHMLDCYEPLRELAGLALPNSLLICGVPNLAYVKHRIRLLLGLLPRTGTDRPVEEWELEGWDGGHLHAFTRGALGVLLRQTGWRPIEWSGWGDRFPLLGPLRRRYPSLLSGEIIAACLRE